MLLQAIAFRSMHANPDKNPYLFARPVTSPLDSDEGITRDCSQRLPVRHIVELLDTSVPAAFPCDVAGELLLACTPTVILPGPEI